MRAKKDRNTTGLDFRTTIRKTRWVKLSIYMAIFLTILALNLATALAQVQSHRLSEIRTIDKNLDLDIYQVNASYVNATTIVGNDSGQGGVPSGTGVFGSGSTNSVYGRYNSSVFGYLGGTHVFGKVGVYGQYNPFNWGILGYRQAGVYGKSDTTGGFFTNEDTDGYPAIEYGVYAEAVGFGGSDHRGVEGRARDATTNYGVLGESFGGTTDYGVYGNGTTYGVYGCDRDNCGNVYGYLGGGTTGVFGKGTVYAGQFEGNVTSDTDFCIGSGGNCLSTVGGGIGGSGTAKYIPMFSTATTLGDSELYQNGASIGIGTTGPNAKLDVRGGEIVGNNSGAGSIFTGYGVFGTGSTGGVAGAYDSGVYARMGTSSGYGLIANSDRNNAIVGRRGLPGFADYDAGVVGVSDAGAGVYAVGTPYGIFADGVSGSDIAAFFADDVNVTGDINIGVLDRVNFGSTSNSIGRSSTNGVVITTANNIRLNPTTDVEIQDDDLVLFDGSICVADDGSCSKPPAGSIVAEGNITVGSGTIFLDGTNNEIGIGTLDPTSQLHVYGGAGGGFPNAGIMRLEDDADAYIVIETPNNRGGGIAFVDDAVGGIITYNHSTDELVLNAHDSDKVWIGDTRTMINGDLNVTGGVQISNTTDAKAGMMRWSGSDFQGYNGTGWASLTSGTGGGGGMTSFNIDTDGEVATTITDGETITFSNSTGMSVSRSGNTITFQNTGVTSETDPYVDTVTTNNVCYGLAGGNVECNEGSNFYWDRTNNRLGLGTSSPGATLSVGGAGTPNMLIYSESPTASTVPIFANKTTTDGTAIYGVSSASSGQKTGVAGSATNAGTNYGLAGVASSGTTNYAVWGQATGGTTNYGGYFLGDGYFSGELGIGISPVDPLHVLTDSGGDAIHLEENSGGEDWQLGIDSAGDLNFEDSGTSRITFEDGGQVGIGTDAPATDLEVKSASGTTTTVRVTAPEWNSAGDYGEIQLGDANHYVRGEYSTGMTIYDTDKITLSTVGDIYLNPSGDDVFVGTTQLRDSTRFEVRPTGQRMLMWDASNDYTFEMYGGNTLDVYLRSGDRSSFIGRGNVGIGDTNPAYRLDVTGDRLRIKNSGNTKNFSLRVDGSINDMTFGGADLLIGGSESGDDVLMSIGSGRNVGIGTWIPGSKLTVNGDIELSGQLNMSAASPVINPNGASGGSLILGGSNSQGDDVYIPDGMLWVQASGSSSNANIFSDGELFVEGQVEADGGIFFINSYSQISSNRDLYIDSDGNLGTLSSSRRYKQNITDFETDFSKILDVEPKIFQRINSTGEWEIGYIAEDFVDLGLENLVFFDEPDLPAGIYYEQISLYTIEVMKDQQSRIENQEVRIEQLKALVCLDHPDADVCN